MIGIIILSLYAFVSPARAGVVAPVEMAVAPSGPASPAAPVSMVPGAPFGGLGGPMDLRGGLPLLPAPVIGLASPGAFNFAPPMAESVAPAAAAASALRPEGALPRGSQRRNPMVPAETAPAAALFQPTGKDRAAAWNTPEAAASASPRRSGETLEGVAPEDAASYGRRQFDQSSRAGHGPLIEPLLNARRAPDGASPRLAGASQAAATSRGGFHSERLSDPASGAGAALADRGSEHGSGGAGSYAPNGETFRDAVAAMPAGIPPAAAFGAAAAGVSRPQPLNLSREGLIVRVRAALGAVLSPAPLKGIPAGTSGEGLRAARFSVPSETAWLERGALLEAVSVAEAYAGSGVRAAVTSSRSVADGPLEPLSSPVAAPLWWAWAAALPFLAAIIRGSI